MIDNYLDWVKRQRKYCVDCAIRDARISRKVTNDWAKGFYKGLAMASDYSGQNFKRLQKDIEARHRKNEHIVSSGLFTDNIYDVLS